MQKSAFLFYLTPPPEENPPELVPPPEKLPPLLAVSAALIELMVKVFIQM